MDFVIDFILHIDQYMIGIVQEYHMWTYAILFLIIFCETGLVVTPFLPGDSLLFVAGAIAALPGIPITLPMLILVVFVAAVLGDSCNYMIGHFFGTRLFSNPDSRIFKQGYLDKTHEFYKKYGGKTIILARFVPIVRTFAPFVAGMGKCTTPISWPTMSPAERHGCCFSVVRVISSAICRSYSAISNCSSWRLFSSRSCRLFSR